MYMENKIDEIMEDFYKMKKIYMRRKHFFDKMSSEEKGLFLFCTFSMFLCFIKYLFNYIVGMPSLKYYLIGYVFLICMMLIRYRIEKRAITKELCMKELYLFTIVLRLKNYSIDSSDKFSRLESEVEHLIEKLSESKKNNWYRKISGSVVSVIMVDYISTIGASSISFCLATLIMIKYLCLVGIASAIYWVSQTNVDFKLDRYKKMKDMLNQISWEQLI